MKQLVLFAAIALLATSCRQDDTATLTDKVKSVVILEVEKAFGTFLELAAKADMKVFDYFGESEDFWAINNGYRSSFTDFKKATGDVYKVVKSQQFTARFEGIQVIDKENAIWTWGGDDLLTFKNDSTFNIKDYSLTALVKKVDKTWKIVYLHESYPCSSDVAPVLTKLLQ